jgi:hypothetical protein
MMYRVFVDYQVAAWNMVCARVIENFGLPGDAYSTRFTEAGIEFLFNQEEDAFRAQLMV